MQPSGTGNREPGDAIDDRFSFKDVPGCSTQPLGGGWT